jgi:hypothetical protein
MRADQHPIRDSGLVAGGTRRALKAKKPKLV